MRGMVVAESVGRSGRLPGWMTSEMVIELAWWGHRTAGIQLAAWPLFPGVCLPSILLILLRKSKSLLQNP